MGARKLEEKTGEMENIECKVCGTKNPSDAQFCIICGKKFLPKRWRDMALTITLGIATLYVMIIFIMAAFTIILSMQAVFASKFFQMTVREIIDFGFQIFIAVSAIEFVLILPVYFHFDDLEATIKWSGLPIENTSSFLRDIAIGGFLGLLYALLVRYISRLFEGSTTLKAQYPSFFVVGVLISIFIVALSEEILFRGFLQQSIDLKLRNPLVSILMASAVFSVIHPVFPTILIAFAAGLMAGILYEKFGRKLHAPIAFHYVYDTLIILLPALL